MQAVSKDKAYIVADLPEGLPLAEQDLLFDNVRQCLESKANHDSVWFAWRKHVARTVRLVREPRDE